MDIKNQWQTVVIVGAQWGDEGKGKVTDYYGYQTAWLTPVSVSKRSANTHAL